MEVSKVGSFSSAGWERIETGWPRAVKQHEKGRKWFALKTTDEQVATNKQTTTGYNDCLWCDVVCVEVEVEEAKVLAEDSVRRSHPLLQCR